MADKAATATSFGIRSDCRRVPLFDHRDVGGETAQGSTQGRGEHLP
jgi:hypothetical protein